MANLNMSVKETSDLEKSQSVSRARAQAFLSSLDPKLNLRDDHIVGELSSENSSAKSKLGKLYRFIADATKDVGPYVACGKGCSACCKMNVSVTSTEAERLASVSGKRMAKVSNRVSHPVGHFGGMPCPFLVNDTCSVYNVRPYACRAHFSFDTSSHWCQPEHAHVDGMCLLGFGGARTAYDAIARGTSLRGFADIRDFFPD